MVKTCFPRVKSNQICGPQTASNGSRRNTVVGEGLTLTLPGFGTPLGPGAVHECHGEAGHCRARAQRPGRLPPDHEGLCHPRARWDFIRKCASAGLGVNGNMFGWDWPGWPWKAAQGTAMQAWCWMETSEVMGMGECQKCLLDQFSAILHCQTGTWGEWMWGGLYGRSRGPTCHNTA